MRRSKSAPAGSYKTLEVKYWDEASRSYRNAPLNGGSIEQAIEDGTTVSYLVPAGFVLRPIDGDPSKHHVVKPLLAPGGVA